MNQRISKEELYILSVAVTHEKLIPYLSKEIYDQFEIINSDLIVEDDDNSIVSAISNSAIPSQDSPQFLNYNSYDGS